MGFRNSKPWRFVSDLSTAAYLVGVGSALLAVVGAIAINLPGYAMGIAGVGVGCLALAIWIQWGPKPPVVVVVLPHSSIEWRGGARTPGATPHFVLHCELQVTNASPTAELRIVRVYTTDLAEHAGHVWPSGSGAPSSGVLPPGTSGVFECSVVHYPKPHLDGGYAQPRTIAKTVVAVDQFDRHHRVAVTFGR